tara:strand:- start:3264 stop:3617 length:354 start_codon:yes stop_codon:yes gene_type:complete
MKTIELDTKILNKNLEITRITKQLDDLTSDYVALKEEFKQNLLKEREHLNNIVDLHKVLDNQREQTPMHMLNTLEKCYDFIKLVKKLSLQDDVKGHLQVKSSGLTQDLREVIKFLEK